MFNTDPTAYLPHRPPFLFIDRLLELKPGVAALGELTVTGVGYFPPLLLVEAMAQLGGIAALSAQWEGVESGGLGFLAGLDRVQLPPFVRPRTRLSVQSRVVRNFGRLVLIAGEVLEGGETIASATLTLASPG